MLRDPSTRLPLIAAIALLAACMYGCDDPASSFDNAQFKTMNDQQQAIHDHIRAFITAYEAWESDAHGKTFGPAVQQLQMLGTGSASDMTMEMSNSLDEISQSYVDRLGHFFVADAVIRSPGVTKPLTHESQFEHIRSIEKQGDQFVVVTEMARKNGITTIRETFTYSVVFEGQEPKIAEIEWSPEE